jgi:general secretion pathway protein D
VNHSRDSNRTSANRAKSRVLAMVVAPVLLAACATQGTGFGTSDVALSEPALNASLDRVGRRGDAGVAARDGIRALMASDHALATKNFARALKLDPENPQLHLLNAIAYHLGFSRGVQANRDLAETGYQVALRLDPNNATAAAMLGQLYLDWGRQSDASRWLGKSVLLDGGNARTFHSLAVAAYYTRDLKLALYAIDNAERLEGQTAPVLRAGTLIRAASGQFGEAEKRLEQYNRLEPDLIQKRALATRVAQWKEALGENARHPDGSQTRGIEGVRISQLATGSPSGTMAPTLPDSGPIAPNWSDCSAPGGGTAYGAPGGGFSAGTQGTDEAVQLPPLPSPCAGRPMPRMAVIDVVVVRSEDTRSTSKGINLLQALSVTLSGNLLDYSRTYGRDGTGPTNNLALRRESRVAWGTPSSNGITYSLNIANASDLANEVIARPSLLVLDRHPSNFYSGFSLSTVSQGTFGSASLVQQPVGVSLSVTPTFVDDDSMLLAVRATRSSILSGVDLSKTVQALRNVASANVFIRFNETLVLSGLSEQDIQESESGVPILKEVPLLQYLFKEERTARSNRSVLVLITPRRTEAAGEDLAAQGVAETAPEVREIRERASKWLVTTHNLDLVLANLDRKNLDSVGLFRQFRSGDLRSQVWHRPHHFRDILSEIASFLYY